MHHYLRSASLDKNVLRDKLVVAMLTVVMLQHFSTCYFGFRHCFVPSTLGHFSFVELATDFVDEAADEDDTSTQTSIGSSSSSPSCTGSGGSVRGGELHESHDGICRSMNGDVATEDTVISASPCTMGEVKGGIGRRKSKESSRRCSADTWTAASQERDDAGDGRSREGSELELSKLEQSTGWGNRVSEDGPAGDRDEQNLRGDEPLCLRAQAKS